eukprot:2469886-Rhodomonas_salina.2
MLLRSSVRDAPSPDADHRPYTLDNRIETQGLYPRPQTLDPRTCTPDVAQQQTNKKKKRVSGANCTELCAFRLISGGGRTRWGRSWGTAG